MFLTSYSFLRSKYSTLFYNGLYETMFHLFHIRLFIAIMQPDSHTTKGTKRCRPIQQKEGKNYCKMFQFEFGKPLFDVD